MEEQQIHVRQWPNGLVLLAERMEWVESAAFTLLLPAGCIWDPDPLLGLANLACDMAQRGCGSRDSRQFIEDLDNLGVDHGAGVSTVHTSFSGSVLARNLAPALEIFADLVRRPHLPEGQLEESRQVCIQEIRALEDDLPQRVMLQLRRQQYPQPYSRCAVGELETVQRITWQDVTRFVQQRYIPEGTILAVAGNIDWAELQELVDRLFGDWQGSSREEVSAGTVDPPYAHIAHPSQQTHIGVAYPCVPYRDERYYEARAAVGVLSDGMSSRLFTEVREKRGLCYAVYASIHSLRDRGAVFCYAGTTTERAQETLSVLLQELRRLKEGIEEEELQRLKTRLKSALVMQQESSGARCRSMAGDWYYLGRVRTLKEISQRVDALTCQSINRFLAENPPGPFTVATLGSQPLEVACGVS